MTASLKAVSWLLVMAAIAVLMVVVPLALIHFAGNALRVAFGMEPM